MNHNQIPGGDPDQRPGDQNNNRNGKGTKNGQTILIFLVISLVVLLLVNFMNGIPGASMPSDHFPPQKSHPLIISS